MQTNMGTQSNNHEFVTRRLFPLEPQEATGIMREGGFPKVIWLRESPSQRSRKPSYSKNPCITLAPGIAWLLRPGMTLLMVPGGGLVQASAGLPRMQP